MTKRIQLPVPLNNIYFEPLTWQMPKGVVRVVRLNDEEVARLQNPSFKYLVASSSGELLTVCESVTQVLISMTRLGFAVDWSLLQD